MAEYDPYSYDIHEDPYPAYKLLRDEAPLYHNERLGFWALSRHGDVIATLKDTQRFTNKHGVALETLGLALVAVAAVAAFFIFLFSVRSGSARCR